MIERTKFYQECQKAFFDGFNEVDVAKFYSENSFEAEEWLHGMKDAKHTADVFQVPRAVFKANEEEMKPFEQAEKDWEEKKRNS